MTAGDIRVALFPCTYREIDGVANTSRQFAAFAKEHGFAFLLVHAGPRDEVVTDGSITRVQLRRGRVKFPLDGHHEFDLLFLRHYPKLLRLMRDFSPDVIHITGPSDVGILGPSWPTTWASLWQPPGRRISISLPAAACPGCFPPGRRMCPPNWPPPPNSPVSTRRLAFTKYRGCSSLRIVNWLSCSERPPASPAS